MMKGGSLNCPYMTGGRLGEGNRGEKFEHCRQVKATTNEGI